MQVTLLHITRKEYCTNIGLLKHGYELLPCDGERRISYEWFHTKCADNLAFLSFCLHICQDYQETE